MFKYFLVFVLLFPLKVLSEPIDKNQWLELGAGIEWGGANTGLKGRYEMDDYLLGLEVSHTNGLSLFSASIQEITEINFLYGKQFTDSFSNLSWDIGVGYIFGDGTTECTGGSSLSIGGAIGPSSNRTCTALSDVNTLSIPMSITYSIGKYVGMGITFSFNISTVGNPVGLKIVIPFGDFN